MAWSYPLASELSPLATFRELQNEMNRWFDSDIFSSHMGYPLVTVWYDGDKAIASAVLPGVDPAKVDVTVNGNLLTISGTRETNPQKEGEVAHRRERPQGKFMRSIELPFAIDNSGVTAEYKNGMLTLTLPRVPEQKPRKIQIN